MRVFTKSCEFSKRRAILPNLACDAKNICSQSSNVQEIGVDGWNGTFPMPRPVPDPLTASWLSALNASYGGSINGDTVEWFPTPSEIRQWSDQGGSLRGMDDWTSTTMLSATILNSATSSDAADEQYILSQTRDITCGSRPCNAVLGGGGIAKQDGQWKVLELQKYVNMGGNSGSFDQAPRVIQIGKGHPSFLAS